MSCAELQLSVSRTSGVGKDSVQRVTYLMNFHLLHEELWVTKGLNYESICS